MRYRAKFSIEEALNYFPELQCTICNGIKDRVPGEAGDGFTEEQLDGFSRCHHQDLSREELELAQLAADFGYDRVGLGARRDNDDPNGRATDYIVTQGTPPSADDHPDVMAGYLNALDDWNFSSQTV